MKFFRYLYYRLYSWNLRQWGDQDLPQFNALLGVSFLIYLNILALGEVIFVLFSSFLPTFNTFVKIFILIVGYMLLLLNFFLFVYKKKYKEIAERFNNETKTDRNRRSVILWLYVIFSFCVPVLIALLASFRH